MPLHTITFDELRDRNNGELDRATARLHGAPSIVQVQQERMQRLLSHRSDIEELASAQRQREAYGVERWHADFVLLRDLHTHAELPKYEGEALRNYLWSQIPNSRFKRFQELFARPEQRAVPRFTVNARGDVDFGTVDFNAISLNGCLISGDRIPEKLAEDLKLCDFTDDVRNPYVRLEKKTAQIPHLKLLWESTVPLQEGQHRLLRIEQPDAELLARYPNVEPHDPRLHGTILYTREQENGTNGQHTKGPKPPRNLIAQHFDSAYAALRKTTHEERLYMEELTELTTLREELRSMNAVLNRDWKRDADPVRKQELQEQAQSLLARAAGQLQACIGRYKLEAHDLLERSASLQDRSGKLNITVAMTKTVAAIDRLAKRFREMNPKGGCNHQDRMVLHREIASQEAALKGFRFTFAANAAKHLQNGFVLFNADQPLQGASLEANVRGVEHRLGDPSGLERISLQPLRTYADRIGTEWQKLHDALVSRDRNAAMDEAVKIHLIGKFQAVRTCIEHLKGFTNETESIPVSRALEFVHTLNTLFGELQLLPNRTVPSYVQPFLAMRSRLAELERGLLQYAQTEMATDERNAMYKRLKQYLDGFAIEEIVASLA